jgi:hypothetical protein
MEANKKQSNNRILALIGSLTLVVMFAGCGVTSHPSSSNAAAPVSTQPGTANGGPLVLNASAASLSFGAVNVSSSGTQTVALTNAGTENVTISNVSIAGAGFNASGVPAGTIVTPGQTAILSATFTPAACGNMAGSITVTSDSSGGSKVIALSGTGAASVRNTVALSWTPSTSTVVGYNVYVSTVSGGSYMKLTPSPVQTTSYTDSGLQTAQVRYYVATSVDSDNNESAFSNEIAANIP